MRVALLGAGHWHVPLYEAALLNAGVDIVAVSAKEAPARERLGRLFGCPSFATESALLESCAIDFAFVFGWHREMFDIGRMLIERGIALSIEKPAAFDDEGRRTLRDLAGERAAFISFPLVYRVTPLPGLLDTLLSGDSELAHLSVRCFAGPPSRYLENGSPWMVDPEQSGGGCTRNLAPHYVDLFLRAIRGRAVSVAATMNSLAYGAAVEDYSSMRIVTDRGAVATIETGYNFPVQYGLIRDFSLVASTTSAFLRASETAVEIFDRAGEVVESRDWNIDSNAAFTPYVTDVLRRFRDGEKPVISFDEFNATMHVIEESYVSNKTSCPVLL